MPPSPSTDTDSAAREADSSTTPTTTKTSSDTDQPPSSPQPVPEQDAPVHSEDAQGDADASPNDETTGRARSVTQWTLLRILLCLSIPLLFGGGFIVEALKVTTTQYWSAITGGNVGLWVRIGVYTHITGILLIAGAIIQLHYHIRERYDR